MQQQKQGPYIEKADDASVFEIKDDGNKADETRADEVKTNGFKTIGSRTDWVDDVLVDWTAASCASVDENAVEMLKNPEPRAPHVLEAETNATFIATTASELKWLTVKRISNIARQKSSITKRNKR